MTQLEAARRGELTPAIQQVAASEMQAPEVVLAAVAEGSLVIPANIKHKGLKPAGIGKGLRTKVNANIGTSECFPDLKKEVEKLQTALAAGADAVMDLSTGGNIAQVQAALLAVCPVPFGTVPLYQAAAEALQNKGAQVNFTADELFAVIERQATLGVDFMTVHAGLTWQTLAQMQGQGRLVDIVSRGGSLMLAWMVHHNQENPLYNQYDRLLELARTYDVTLSLGDALRPGCVADATDRGQMQELLILGELADRARAAGVQVLIEGPGHMPLDQIAANVQLEKQVCRGAPFYVLGPIVTDIAPGYDHITAAIGGAIAAAAGVDFLCYVTPAEHLGLPTSEEVRAGVMASRIAAHAGDLVKGLPGAAAWDRAMAKARKALDWQQQIALALDPEKVKAMLGEKRPAQGEACSMCGSYCAMKLASEYLAKPQI